MLDLIDPAEVLADDMINGKTPVDRALREATRDNPPIFSDNLRLEGQVLSDSRRDSMLTGKV